MKLKVGFFLIALGLGILGLAGVLIYNSGWGYLAGFVSGIFLWRSMR